MGTDTNHTEKSHTVLSDGLLFVLPEWLLCALATGGLLRNVYNGYDMQDVLSFSLPMICLFTAGLLLLLYWITAGGRRRMLAGLAAGIAAVLVVILIMSIFKPFVDERNSSGMIFWILLILIGIGAFWLTRLQYGSVIYLAAGNFIMAAEVFLEFGLITPGYLLFLFAGAGLMLYRLYRINAQSLTAGDGTAGDRISDSSSDAQGDALRDHGPAQEGDIARGYGSVQTNDALRGQRFARERRYLMQIAAAIGAAAGIAALVFFLVVVPLNPPTQDLVLIERLKSMQVIQKVGVTSILSEIDYDLESDQETNTERTAKQTEEEDDNEREETEEETDTENDETAEGTDEELSTKDTDEKQANAIRYTRMRIGWIIVIAACIAGWILLHRLHLYRRRRWFERICAMDHRDGVTELYRYFLKALSIVHVQKQDHLTLREFAKSGRKYTDPFIYGDVHFKDLTEIYDKTCYGGAPVSSKEWELFETAYRDFRFNVKEELGFWRYIPVFFRI